MSLADRNTLAPSMAVRDESRRSIVSLEEVQPASWETLLEDFEDANFYQTPAYGACHWSAKQLRLVALKSNGQTLAMAQLRIVRVPMIRQGIAYLRWGPLCRLKSEAFQSDQLHRILSALKHKYVDGQGLLLRVLPPVFHSDEHAKSFESVLAGLAFRRNTQARTFRTIRLDLSGSLESLRKGFNSKWRNMLNGAERNNLTISEGADLEFYDRFLAAYREMMERKRFETTVDVSEFREMQAQLAAPLKMQIFLCLKEGKVLNAVVLSAMGDSAIYLLGATSDEGLKLKGAYLLHWRAIQWLKERGIRWYDLGGIDPAANPGVYHFKSGFGGQETDHLGTYELSASRGSAFCITTAERLQRLTRRVRGSFRRK